MYTNSRKKRLSKRPVIYRKKRKGRKRSRYFLLIIMFLLAAGITFALNYNRISLFFLSNKTLHGVKVDFEGANVLKVEELLQIIRIPSDANILQVDLQGVCDRLKQNPWVKHVVVKRNAFRHYIKVKLVERTPIALINCQGIYGVDEEGVALPSERMKSMDFPLVSGIDQMEPQVGKQLNSQQLATGLAVLQEARIVHLEKVVKVSEVSVSDTANIILFTDNPVTEVRLGSENFRRKLVFLKAVFPRVRADYQNIEYIDLRFGEEVVVKPH